MKIITLTWQQTIPIRHQVLWPTEDPSYCQVDGDEDALHFGVLEGDQLHCVASLYINGQSARLRKFATIQQAQGKGLGSFMLNFLIEHLRKSEVKRFWFDARESALDFYRRFGFSVEGTRFYKNDVAYFRMYMDW